MLAITKGTTSYRAIKEAKDLTPSEVAFLGDFVMLDLYRPAMLWDDGLQNVRPMSPAEVAAALGKVQQSNEAADQAAAFLKTSQATLQQIIDETDPKDSSSQSIISLAKFTLSLVQVFAAAQLNNKPSAMVGAQDVL